MNENKVKYSIIIPVFNEEGSVKGVHKELVETMDRIEDSYEILFLDDESIDNIGKK